MHYWIPWSPTRFVSGKLHITFAKLDCDAACKMYFDKGQLQKWHQLVNQIIELDSLQASITCHVAAAAVVATLGALPPHTRASTAHVTYVVWHSLHHNLLRTCVLATYSKCSFINNAASFHKSACIVKNSAS